MATANPTRPVFYLLAGPNGAGKSTLYKALKAAGKLPKDAEFVNADVYESAPLQHIQDPLARSEAARDWANARRAQLLTQGQSFVSETVFSHASKLALIQDAQAKGFFVLLLVVALDQPERVLEGGHNGRIPFCSYRINSPQINGEYCPLDYPSTAYLKSAP